MSVPEFESLSPEVERLLAYERRLPSASPGLRTRALGRARGVLDGASSPFARPTWRSRTTVLLAATLVLGVAGLSFAAWQAHRRTDIPPTGGDAPLSANHPAPSSPVPPVAAPPSPAPEAPAAPPPSIKDDRAPATRRPTDGAAYAVELGLLQRARTAVASKKFSVALDSIAEHERLFPAGRLREEREALRVKALSGLGRQDDARAAAERFRDRYPRSVLSSSIEETMRRGP
jgi:hypothetical protein